MSTDRNKVRSAIEVYLDNKHCTLYLDWDITNENGRAKAIEFLTDLYLDLEEQIGHQFPETTTGNVIEVAFGQGVRESMDVDAPRNWRFAPPEAWDRAASMRRHPSAIETTGRETSDEPT